MEGKIRSWGIWQAKGSANQVILDLFGPKNIKSNVITFSVITFDWKCYNWKHFSYNILVITEML